MTAVPAWLGLGAGAAAVVLTAFGTGDVLLLALVLAAVAGPRAAAGVLLACLSVAVRAGATGLAATAGAQAVLGPAGLVGPPLHAASAWAGGLALVAAARNGPAAVPFGLAAGFVVAGPAFASAGDAAVRLAGAATGVAVAAVGARLAGRLPDQARASIVVGAGGAAMLFAVAAVVVPRTAPSADGAGAAALAFILVAGAVIAAGRDRWLIALVGLALAAAAAGEPTAFWLLAAAALVGAAVGHPAALVAMLPGGVVAVDAALASGGVGRVALAAGAVVTAGWGLRGVRQPPRLALRHVPAMVLAGALLLAPHTWAWAGLDTLEAELLRGTARGVAFGVLGGSVAVILGWATGQTAAPRPETSSS